MSDTFVFGTYEKDGSLNLSDSNFKTEKAAVEDAENSFDDEMLSEGFTIFKITPVGSYELNIVANKTAQRKASK